MPPAKKKKIVTPAVKRQLQKARREIAKGKAIGLEELLGQALRHDVRKAS
jgi:hypothetical protein